MSGSFPFSLAYSELLAQRPSLSTSWQHSFIVMKFLNTWDCCRMLIFGLGRDGLAIEFN